MLRPVAPNSYSPTPTTEPENHFFGTVRISNMPSSPFTISTIKLPSPTLRIQHIKSPNSQYTSHRHKPYDTPRWTYASYATCK